MARQHAADAGERYLKGRLSWPEFFEDDDDGDPLIWNLQTLVEQEPRSKTEVYRLNIRTAIASLRSTIAV
jgi:hypothetical protein